MYLKSIEIQGFKSFANRIVFDFHNGITGIVGPNGSGKSNVADAVRWVLGEQSAKQLRGSKMEDVIFAGTQLRKPVGYAYVAITLDNSDKALPIDYDELTVSRRVFRSGESEYKINNNSCRLKDISELFYDTGIGKEGYSIIGQGQIDKILSGKPDERRELFDEAAGIVKFKRRKAAAVKKLDSERDNLTRVNDILLELEKQVAPLEKQSEKAREYLALRDALKTYEVNGFLLETDKIKSDLKKLSLDYEIVEHDLEDKKNQYESTRSEYDEAEAELAQAENDIEMATEFHSNTILDKQRLVGTARLYDEQIKTIENDSKHYNDRINAINSEIAEKNSTIEDFNNQNLKLSESLKEFKENQAKLEEEHARIIEETKELSDKVDSSQSEVYSILNEKTSITANNQRFKTMIEQYTIKKAELNSSIIQKKSEEEAQNNIIKNYHIELTEVDNKINDLTAAINVSNTSVMEMKNEISELSVASDKEQQQYHREKSRLESLINITEKYDGYNNSIRRVMEKKDTTPGIIGVIADIIKVERKYETAIETALGGTIQNIVTDNENTAKSLINYLKQNRFGRATFLPLSSIAKRGTYEKDDCIKEKGVIGVASNLVRVSFEYENLAKYLLGRVLVVDNVDNALAIARKYKYSLRIVTLEGEQLNPGGSMTGGAFKNSSNLLGRRREIEDLKVKTSEIGKSVNEKKTKITDLRKEVSSVREKLEADSKMMRELQLKKNTCEINLKQANSRLSEIRSQYEDSKREVDMVVSQIKDIENSLNNENKALTELNDKNEVSVKEIENLNKLLEDKKQEELRQLELIDNLKLQFSSSLQRETFINENVSRLNEEIAKSKLEIESILSNLSGTKDEIDAKKEQINEVEKTILAADKQLSECIEKINKLKADRDKIKSTHKEFFDKREMLSAQINDLEKENYRLSTLIEKNNDNNDALVEHMWNEYELTYNYALELKNDEYDNLSDIKKRIAEHKLKIKGLGDVNVNSIEEYKEVSERYAFLKNQHDDLVKAEESLVQIISELDSGMRTQFSAKFEEIKQEFDKVFRELFGGGKGTIQLVEGEDILDAGINIISQPPGKKLQNMMQLSGGEKALTAISLLFAIQNLKPSPFCLLDEIEAALDDSNVSRYAEYLHKLTKHTQFIVITHRRGTMTAADRLYGITMQEKGISTLVSVDLIEKDLDDKKN